MLLVILLLVLVSIILLSSSLFPIFSQRLAKWQTKKQVKVEKELDQMFYTQNPMKIMRLYFILPLALAGLGFLFLKSIILALAGAVFGLLIPNFLLKIKDNQRRQKFNSQILDAIMILSSSLKGGLSLLQAFEVLVEEMPAPINQEIGLVVRENKMGVLLEQSLKHLNERMKMEELTLVINSIMVARETGGDLTKVFSRLTTTIRDNRKLKDSIKTLTLQGRMQGIIMSVLPFLFIWWVLTFNKQHFDIMLQSDIGRMLLFIAGFLQIVGMFLIKKFSTIKI